MAENLTRQEMEDAQESLISPDMAGPITSLDHRTFNSMLMDYNNSFLDFDVYTIPVPGFPDRGMVKDDRLKKRLVSKILLCDANIVISENFLSKVLASDTLMIDVSQGVPPSIKVTISFKQQPI